MHGHRGIGQDGLGPGGGHRDVVAGAVGQHVFEEVQFAAHLVEALVMLQGHAFGRFGGGPGAVDFHVLHFQVGNRGLQTGGPVDDAVVPVNQALFPQVHERGEHRTVVAWVQGEGQAGPVAGSAHAADLLDDDAAVLFLPFPDALFKGLAAQVVTGLALFGQGLFHLELGGDARVVGAGHPEGGFAPHPVVANHEVFHGQHHGVAQVEFAGHVGRRHGNHEGLHRGVEAGLVGVVPGLEVALLLPLLVDLGFQGVEVEGFGDIVGHGAPPLWPLAVG